MLKNWNPFKSEKESIKTPQSNYIVPNVQKGLLEDADPEERVDKDRFVPIDEVGHPKDDEWKSYGEQLKKPEIKEPAPETAPPIQEPEPVTPTGDGVYHATGDQISDFHLYHGGDLENKNTDTVPDSSFEEEEEKIKQNESAHKLRLQKSWTSNQEVNQSLSSRRNPKGDNMKTMNPEKRERQAQGQLREMLHRTESESEKETLLSMFGTVDPKKIDAELQKLVDKGDLILLDDDLSKAA